MRAADSTRTSFEASRSSREAASADETSRTPLGTFGGSPTGDKTRARADGSIVAGSATRARGVRTEIVEVAAGKGCVVRGSLLAAQHRLHRALVSPAERAKTAPAIPNPAPKTAHPRAEGVPLRGGKALSGKGGAHLNAREPHEVGRRFTVHRPSIDEIRQKTRKTTQDSERPKSGRTNFL